MGAALSHFTHYLANTLCSGSSRKLIAGWWYSILTLSLLITLMAFWTVSTRTKAEGFASAWASIIIILLCVGGTMVMRRFHNSIAVGFFMGSVVATSQLFFLLFLIYLGYASDRKEEALPYQEENLNAMFCIIQSVLLGTFAAILGAHRSEILDSKRPAVVGVASEDSGVTDGDDTYNPPEGTFS